MEKLYRDFFFHFDITVMLVFFCLTFAFSVLFHFSILTVLIFLFGLFFFMFSEYITHRFLFHLKAPKNPFFLKILKRLHYDHHTNPDDLKLLFLPIWYSIPNFLVLTGIFYAITRNGVYTVAFGAGLIAMLLVYEWKHYIAHRPIKPKTKFGQWMKKLHLLHHFKNENYWYGVSNPFVDQLFGTLKGEKDVKTSKTAKALEKR
ncbi:MAG: sterol desaturase family protein [Bacillaceae bacterium]